MSTLVWNEDHQSKLIYAETHNSAKFRIFYDDVMYWPSWSKDCTQDLDGLKAEAQELHDKAEL